MPIPNHPTFKQLHVEKWAPYPFSSMILTASMLFRIGQRLASERNTAPSPATLCPGCPVSWSRGLYPGCPVPLPSRGALCPEWPDSVTERAAPHPAAPNRTSPINNYINTIKA